MLSTLECAEVHCNFLIYIAINFLVLLVVFLSYLVTRYPNINPVDSYCTKIFHVV